MRRLVAVLLALLSGTVLLVATTACSRVVSGTPERAIGVNADSGHGYGYARDRCGLLADDTVQEILEADELVKAYIGALCQYVLRRGSEIIDVTFIWFESGTLERERSVADGRNEQVTDVVVQRRDGFLARSASGCAATAGTDPGVASWWVQFPADSASDECQTAEELLDRTLSADL